MITLSLNRHKTTGTKTRLWQIKSYPVLRNNNHIEGEEEKEKGKRKVKISQVSEKARTSKRSVGRNDDGGEGGILSYAF